MILEGAFSISSGSCLILDGKPYIPEDDSCSCPVNPPVNPPSGSCPSYSYTGWPDDTFIWAVARYKNPANVADGIYIEWKFKGDVDGYNVYIKNGSGGYDLLNTSLLTEEDFLHLSGTADSEYKVESIRSGSVVHSIENIKIDLVLNDNNMIIAGSIIGMSGLPLENVEVFVYNENNVPNYAHRTLISKIKVKYLTDDTGRFFLYVLRGYAVTIAIASANFRKTIETPCDLTVIYFEDIIGV